MPATASARIRDCIGTLLHSRAPTHAKQVWKPARHVRALAGAARATRACARWPGSTRIRLQWEGWWLRSRRGARAGIAAAMPSASQSDRVDGRSEEHTSELQSLMRISYSVLCLKKKK